MHIIHISLAQFSPSISSYGSYQKSKSIACISRVPHRSQTGIAVTPFSRSVLTPNATSFLQHTHLQRKKRTHVIDSEDPSKKGQPKSFVIRRGRYSVRTDNYTYPFTHYHTHTCTITHTIHTSTNIQTVLKDLESDVRKLLSPNTATNLKETRRNVLKDFIHVAGPLGVTHLLMLSATHNAAYLRIAKSPRGPTLTLRIHEYSLIRDILSSQQRPRAPQKMWLGAPLVVMNNFNSPQAPKEDREHLKLATVLFQNLFPTINVATTKLSGCQRVVLLEYNPETSRISMRHYSIAAQPTGVSKNLKALLKRKKLPNLGKLKDVSEFLARSEYGSESEGEEAEATRVEVYDDDVEDEDEDDETNKSKKKGTSSEQGPRQSRIRLYEVGPRLELEVIKVEEGLCGGKVLYHRYVQKSTAEAAAQENEIEVKQREKEKRRREQEVNVAKKAAEKRRREEEKELQGGGKEEGGDEARRGR